VRRCVSDGFRSSHSRHSSRKEGARQKERGKCVSPQVGENKMDLRPSDKEAKKSKIKLKKGESKLGKKPTFCVIPILGSL